MMRVTFQRVLVCFLPKIRYETKSLLSMTNVDLWNCWFRNRFGTETIPKWKVFGNTSVGIFVLR